MSEVIVEERAVERATPPTFKLTPDLGSRETQEKPLVGETEWMRNLVGRETKVRLLVSGGDMGAKEIGKLIKLLGRSAPYWRTRMMTDKQSQLDKFKEAARELECDDDEARFVERVKKLVKHKPAEDKPE